MALSTWPNTGSVAAYLAEFGVDPSEVLGWCAVYWDGSGSVNTADVFTSVSTPWSVLVSDPETLPEVNLQAYFIFFRQQQSMFTILLDGYDEYFLLGKTNVVTGLLLSDQKWLQLQNKARIAWQHRGQFSSGFSDWLNEVPA